VISALWEDQTNEPADPNFFLLVILGAAMIWGLAPAATKLPAKQAIFGVPSIETVAR
jgi:hypothetical protein